MFPTSQWCRKMPLFLGSCARRDSRGYMLGSQVCLGTKEIGALADYFGTAWQLFKEVQRLICSLRDHLPAHFYFRISIYAMSSLIFKSNYHVYITDTCMYYLLDPRNAFDNQSADPKVLLNSNILIFAFQPKKVHKKEEETLNPLLWRQNIGKSTSRSSKIWM